MFIQQTCFFAKQGIPAEAVVWKILDSEELNPWPVWKNPLRQVSQRACRELPSNSHRQGESIAITIVQHAVTEEEGNKINTNCIFFQFIISVHTHFRIYIGSHKKTLGTCMIKHYF